MTLLPLVSIVVALGAPAAANSDQQALQDAIKLFESFKDAQAAEALRVLLARAPGDAIVAKAHIYLGIIALNEVRPKDARAEFEKAVAADVLVDLPPSQSPKAQILFAEARRSVASGPLAAPPTTAPARPPAGSSPAPHAAPSSAPVEAPAATAVAEGPTPSHAPAYVVGSIGVAALAAGGVFGYLQQQSKNNVVADTSGASALKDAQPYAQDGVVADVLYGAGGVALVTAVILFFTERPNKTAAAPVVTLSVGPGGLALSGAF